jgi:uncharacterized protein (DUF362 family)
MSGWPRRRCSGAARQNSRGGNMSRANLTSHVKNRIADVMPLPAWSAYARLHQRLGLYPHPAARPAQPSLAAFAKGQAGSRAHVSVTHATGYQSRILQSALRATLETHTALNPVIKRGDQVAIKVSLVGGSRYAQKAIKDYGRLPTELYWTHPEVAREVGEWARDAGAAKITFVEALSDSNSWRQFGYQAMATHLGAKFIDLNRPAPYPDFAVQPVGPEALVYDEFKFNHILAEADVVISLAKLKRHHAVGFTGALKNLVGILPLDLYREKPDDSHRSALHRGPDGHSHLARAVVDLARACPIHLAVIDGVLTTLGSEGPWNNDLQPVALETLIVSGSAVAADAVAVQVLGLDPLAADFEEPFRDSLNYLRLADSLGLGPHCPADIALTSTPFR